MEYFYLKSTFLVVFRRDQQGETIAEVIPSNNLSKVIKDKNIPHTVRSIYEQTEEEEDNKEETPMEVDEESEVSMGDLLDKIEGAINLETADNLKSTSMHHFTL